LVVPTGGKIGFHMEVWDACGSGKGIRMSKGKKMKLLGDGNL